LELKVNMNDILPTHVAIIPDGNRRWAKKHGVTTLEGHQAGAETMHNLVEALIRLGVGYLTVWGFSTDNWKRSDTEVKALLSLLEAWIIKDTPWLHSQGVRLKHIGGFQELPHSLQETITYAVNQTAGNTGMTFLLAFNYSGRADITNAVRRMLDAVAPPALVNEEYIAHHLSTDGAPDVDLVIRTAGEYRLSNYLLWQIAYSELYFTRVLWPDFTTEELQKALRAYSRRQRRFGGG
jgi:undecaprenyl diphosphate synthase